MKGNLSTVFAWYSLAYTKENWFIHFLYLFGSWFLFFIALHVIALPIISTAVVVDLTCH
jgi:hypothetical protein